MQAPVRELPAHEPPRSSDVTPAERLRLWELLDAGDLVPAARMLGATRCPRGCYVQAHEYCEHGHPSLGLRMGMAVPTGPPPTPDFQDEPDVDELDAFDELDPTVELDPTRELLPVDEPAAPAEDAPAARPPRRRLSRRMRIAVTGIFVIGALAFAEGAVTVIWQEPFSAFTSARAQANLEDDLDRLESDFAPPWVIAAVPPDSADRLDTHRRERRRTRVRYRRAVERLPRRAAELAGRVGTGGALGRLEIPRLGIERVFVQGADANSLQRGPGHYRGTALPGQRGTVAIAGHRTTYGAPFKAIDRLREGNRIVVSMPYGRFVYEVQGREIVEPSEVAVMRRVSYNRLVLTACHPLFSSSKRIVVFARLAEKRPRGVRAPD